MSTCRSPPRRPLRLSRARPLRARRRHRFNPAKLLLDPYARASRAAWRGTTPRATGPASRRRHRAGRARTAPCSCRAAVIDPPSTGKGDRRPARPGTHRDLRGPREGNDGATPGRAGGLRGTYAGLAAPPVLDHLRGLGVTAVEFARASRGARAGPRRARTHQLLGLQLHRLLRPRRALRLRRRARGQLSSSPWRASRGRPRGHPGRGLQSHRRGGHRGPTLAFRASTTTPTTGSIPRIPVATWTTPAAETHSTRCTRARSSSCWTVCATGCRTCTWTASASTSPPRWPAGRTPSTGSGVLRGHPGGSRDLQVKLIAEPWDPGRAATRWEFPPGWAEWNGRYRDTLRRYWRGDSGSWGSSAPGSPVEGPLRQGRAAPLRQRELRHRPRRPASCTAGGLRAQAQRRERRGQPDGTDANFSWNSGAEGRATIRPSRPGASGRRATSSPPCSCRRAPMLSHGDESGRSQEGNNNAYCHDGPLTWLAWPPDAARLDFTRRLIALRLAEPVFHRRRFFQGRERPGAAGKDLVWLRPDGGRWPTRTGTTRRRGRSASAWPAPPSRSRTSGATRCRALLSCCSSTRMTRRCRSSCPSSGAAAGSWCSIPVTGFRPPPRPPLPAAKRMRWRVARSPSFD